MTVDPPPLPPTAALRALLPDDVRGVLLGPEPATGAEPAAASGSAAGSEPADGPGSGAGPALRHRAARPVWCGVVWGRLGRGDLAAAHLGRVRLAELGPWIAAEHGRLLRELGLHGAAEAVEFPALARAHDPVDAAMLRLSLTADAVGDGDPDRAVRRLAGARAAVLALPEGPRAARQRLRWSWVELEVALLTGTTPDPEAARLLPRWDERTGAPVPVAELRHGTAFHRAKAWLFAAVRHDDPRLLAAAQRDAPPALAWAVALARADRGEPGALDQARSAWRSIVPWPGTEAAVAATAVAARLGPPGGVR